MFLRVLENEAQNARPNAARRAELADAHLELRMFNVGHGESILISFEDGRAWLVDSGVNSWPRNELLGQRLVDFLEARGLTLEAIVPSHPHFDPAGRPRASATAVEECQPIRSTHG